MDISTVSRVANSKYVQTPYGTFLLKTFFSESLSTDSGEDVFEKWSPYHLVLKAHQEYVDLTRLGEEKKSEGSNNLCDIFPKFCVIHGTADKTVSSLDSYHT